MQIESINKHQQNFSFIKTILIFKHLLLNRNQSNQNVCWVFFIHTVGKLSFYSTVSNSMCVCIYMCVHLYLNNTWEKYNRHAFIFYLICIYFTILFLFDLIFIFPYNLQKLSSLFTNNSVEFFSLLTHVHFYE